jgi:hypothetical protein
MKCGICWKENNFWLQITTRKFAIYSQIEETTQRLWLSRIENDLLFIESTTPILFRYLFLCPIGRNRLQALLHHKKVIKRIFL